MGTKTKKTHEKMMLKIVDVLGNYHQWTDESVLFNEVEKLIKTISPVASLVIHSLPVNVPQSENKDAPSATGSVRVIWPLGVVNPNISVLGKKIYLTRKRNQDYFAIIEGLSSLDETQSDIFESVKNYLSNSLAHIFQFKELLRLRELAYIDDVTGLFNQRRLNKDLDKAIANLSNEPGSNFSLLFIDIDYFKKINDGHGHLVGTEVLLQLARHLTTVLRENDLIYRYGGDEFVVLLPGIDGKMAYQIAQRIIHSLKDKAFTVKHDSEMEFHLSVSIGVANCPEDAQEKSAVLNMADEMMYQAKQSGRGQACHISKIVKVDTSGE